MQITTSERALLAHAFREVRQGRFDGSRKAAYTAAGVNAATWTRLEDGESVKEHTLVKVVRTLFPRTDGDWRKLFGGDGQIFLTYWDLNGMRPEEAGAFERALGVAEVADVSDWPAANKELRRMRQQFGALELRIERLEQRLGLAGEPVLSVVRDEVSDAVAAHDEEGSIAGEQEESDTP